MRDVRDFTILLLLLLVLLVNDCTGTVTGFSVSSYWSHVGARIASPVEEMPAYTLSGTEEVLFKWKSTCMSKKMVEIRY